VQRVMADRLLTLADLVGRRVVVPDRAPQAGGPVAIPVFPAPPGILVRRERI